MITNRIRTTTAALFTLWLMMPLQAADIAIDLRQEKIGGEPRAFLPMVGSWTVAADGKDKVIQVDGARWRQDIKSQPAGSLAQNARAIYGARHEAFLDNVKAFAYYPIAVAKDVPDFTGGTITVRFKTVGGQLDRCSGILFNVQPNGDYLAIRYNDTETNVVLWTFNNGVRKSVKRTREGTFPVDRATWHELKMTVHGTEFTSYLDGQPAVAFTLPAPVSGKVGLWSKTDSISQFKDFVVSPAH
jgi:hypothetical protein